MSLVVYEPCALHLPPDLPVVREVRPHRLHISPEVALTDDELRRYDRTTVFYDVFIGSSGRKIIAIGPPTLNLEPYVLPVNMCVVDPHGNVSKTLTFRVKHFSHHSVYEFPLPKGYRTKSGVLKLSLTFPGGHVQELTTSVVPDSPVSISLSTIQKDEPLTWLRDWTTYWFGLGVRRIILYDNGSDYFQELISSAAIFPVELDLIVVNWAFEYGPTRSFDLCFAQWAALNHARLAFSCSGWSAAFDVDEYPITRDRTSLSEFLDSQSRRVGQVKMRGYNVCNTVDAPSPTEPPLTARDFVIRERQASDTTKYFYRTRWARTARVHDADICLLKSSLLDPSIAAYFHYIGLNRGWMHPGRLSRTLANDQTHVEDRSVADALAGWEIV